MAEQSNTVAMCTFTALQCSLDFADEVIVTVMLILLFLELTLMHPFVFPTVLMILRVTWFLYPPQSRGLMAQFLQLVLEPYVGPFRMKKVPSTPSSLLDLILSHKFHTNSSLLIIEHNPTRGEYWKLLKSMDTWFWMVTL